MTATIPTWDEDFITECLVKQEAPRTPVGVVDPVYDCSWCHHPQHGLRCRRSDSCTCESAFTSRDDSWRPWWTPMREVTVLQLMADTGVDGWVAKRATHVNESGRRLKKLLLNQQGTEGSTS